MIDCAKLSWPVAKLWRVLHNMHNRAAVSATLRLHTIEMFCHLCVSAIRDLALLPRPSGAVTPIM